MKASWTVGPEGDYHMKRLLFAAGAALLISTAFAQAAGDLANGEKVFRYCKACHMVGENAKNRVGPELNGIVGRPIASVDSFKYSPAMKAFGEENKVWSAELLTTYLQHPRETVKKTRMAFAGVKKPEDVQDLIAYLSQFSADGSKK